MDQPILYAPEQPLKIIAILHYVLAGIRAFFGAFGFIPIILGIVFAALGDTMKDNAGKPLPAFVPWILIFVGAVWVIIGLVTAYLTFLSARHISRRTGRTFTLVIAALECLNIPFGTALGIFTFIILSKPEVRALYGELPPGAY